ncbi:L-threonylcarbamoyladenylate synthase [Acinetobacter radioresistens]|uniref:L-threonylcarbamoyladenylate synthase n=1 Tax=Acinetobacter radioresistens TaxID=40216 RepID=UPI000C31DE36|nr:Sua5/YciO/YrdC/YwlC family protein [Acinetobacter radioresistens]MDK8756645.1 Sua5/YciO/YrdC/YwlC family protein [Acinetobacter radioresistens]PKH30613.1 tRNA threonylcarbamoyladenosine biosynthesis protein RimN [Acinetobacter radioresistens]
MITTSVTEAAECLSQGKVLAYPTEAVWGLGCDPYNEAAFHEILRLKQRPIEKGVILLAGQLSQVEHLLVSLNQERQQQVIQQWAQRSVTERATTWLLPADEQIPVWIRGQHPKVAVRVTNHPLCVALCNAFNSFIVSTSANPAGLEPARTLQEASQYFGSELNYLNGDLGLSQQPSRITDAITGEIIRA